MQKIAILLFIVLFTGCSAKKVYLIKQWHLSPNESTLDIENSKHSPKYKNQLEIFQKMERLLKLKKSNLVIAEGCEESSKYFLDNFNGWTLERLKKKKNKIDEILAPVPLKMKAKYSNGVEIECGDNLSLVKENNLAFSELKGFTSFYQRLSEYRHKDFKKYEKYKRAFLNMIPLKKGEIAEEIAREKAILELDKFQALIKQRNNYFFKKIKKHLSQNPTVIIGGLHVNDLSRRLELAEIDYEIITPKSYPEEEDSLIKNLRRLLKRKRTQEFVLFQVPISFQVNDFPVKNLIKKEKIASKKEWESLADLAAKYKIPLNLLKSDFDKDGIRDFTLSRSGHQTVLAAEDNDWDNDGVINLHDTSLGKVKFKIMDSEKLTNYFNLEKVKKEQMYQTYKQLGIRLLEFNERKHDALVLKIFLSILKVVKDKPRIKSLVVRKPLVQFGKKTFFSFNQQSKSLEIYIDELINYLKNKKEKEFKLVSYKKYTDSVVVPLLVHSLLHEIAHSKETGIYSLAKKYGWKFDINLSNSIYLSKNREKAKKMIQIPENLLYTKKPYEYYLQQHQEYLKTINKLLRSYRVDVDYIKNLKKTKWFVKSESTTKELQSSFLFKFKIPSLYALSSISEWYAESFAACKFNEIFPAVLRKDVAIKFEHLIGFNPYIHNQTICQEFE